MGDSTAMTIEFLRARLLSERSVSRTARQRADQLAKRVVELEEQLGIMIIQRKKAEKAAAEVLAILENQGEGYFAEVIDSSSDQDDVDGETKGDDVKEDETSNASRVEKSEVEDGLLGSEPEASPSQGRSLSWKGRSSCPDSHGKQKIKQIRQRQRRNSFTSATESSGKHQLGKSCRKIRQSEMRSAAEDELPEPTLDEHGEKGSTLSNLSNEQPEFLREASRHEMEEVFPYTSVACSLDDQIKETDAGLYANKGDKDEEMERVLEQQAQLIGQYQAEENAQREWEEKYNETKSSTSDSCEPGSQPDTTKTCSEPQEEATELAGKNTYFAKEAKLSAEDIPNKEEPTAQSLSIVSVPTVQTPHAIDPEKSGSSSSNKVTANGLFNGSVLPDLTRIGESSSLACSDGVLGQQFNGMVVQDTETSSQEFAFPAQKHWNMSTNGMQDQGMSYGNIDTGSYSNSSIHPNGNGIPVSTSTRSSSSVNSGSKFSKWQSPEMRNQLQRLLPQSPSSRLGGVLQALQRAKTSLGQLSGLPLPNQGTLVTVAPTDSRDRTIKYGGDLDIPIGPTGLFRLPTDSYPHASFSVPKLHGSGLSSTPTYPDVKYAIASSEYQYPSTTYVESGSRISVGRHYFDPYITSGTGIPVSTIYSPPYSHLTAERTPSRDGLSKSGMDLRNEMPAGDRYSLYGGDGALSDMQRL